MLQYNTAFRAVLLNTDGEGLMCFINRKHDGNLCLRANMYLERVKEVGLFARPSGIGVKTDAHYQREYSE